MADDQEHLIAKEGFVHRDERRHERTILPTERTNRYLMLLSVVLGVVCLGLMAALYSATRSNSDQIHSSPIPTMPRTMVNFEPDERFAGPSTQENDQAWSSLTPASSCSHSPQDPANTIPDRRRLHCNRQPEVIRFATRQADLKRPGLRHLALPPVALSLRNPEAPAPAQRLHRTQQHPGDPGDFAGSGGAAYLPLLRLYPAGSDVCW